MFPPFTAPSAFIICVSSNYNTLPDQQDHPKHSHKPQQTHLGDVQYFVNVISVGAAQIASFSVVTDENNVGNINKYNV